MNLFKSSQDRDLELLSAYIDDELSANDRAKLERRLAADAGLRRTLAGLRRVQTTLHALPTVKPPRSYVLKPEMVGQPARQLGLSWLVPALNFATTIAAILFAVVIGSELATKTQPLASSAQAPQSFQAPAVQSAPFDTTTQNNPVEEAPPNSTSSKSVTGTAPVTESAPLRQSPCSDSANQEPLTGGGCGGGTGGGGTGIGGGPTGGSNVLPFASVANATLSVTPGPDVLAAGSTTGNATTASARTGGAEAPSSATTALGNDQTSTEASSSNGTAQTFDYYTATATGPAEIDNQSLSPVRVVELILGGLLILLILASVLIRRR